MKKKYEKPMIAVESFQLDAAIAGACVEAHGWAIGYAFNTCVFEWGAMPVFSNACKDQGAVGDNFIDYGDNTQLECYQAPVTTVSKGIFLAS